MHALAQQRQSASGGWSLCRAGSRCRVAAAAAAAAAVARDASGRSPTKKAATNAATKAAPTTLSAAAVATTAAATAAAAAATAAAALAAAPPALAADPAASAAVATVAAASSLPFAEPANALSLPTWAIHVSSVAEWVVAMSLAWRYADASGDPRWRGLTWGMVPALGSAMCACTWHFFYNAPELDVLVALQAFLTVVGNCTLWAAAYRIYRGGKEAAAAE